MNKNYIISIHRNDWRECIFVFHTDTHRLYEYSKYNSNDRYASLDTIYDLENEIISRTYTSRTGAYAIQTTEYDTETKLYMDFMSSEISSAIRNYLIEKYDAKYILPKCILGMYRSTKHDRNTLYLLDLVYLSKYRDTGYESLYMINERHTILKFKPKQWVALTKPQRKLCINKFRELWIEYESNNCSGLLANTVKDLLASTQNEYYLILKWVNRGRPTACKLTHTDYDWLLRHKNDTAYGRRKSTKLKSYIKRYVQYLEYEYVRERDVTDLYWRHNRNWVTIMQTEQAQILESRVKRVTDSITEYYQDKVKPKISIDGYEFEVTNEPAKWRKQARILHQCIVSNQYYKKQSSTIVLCTKNGAPWATFEVNMQGKIIQSYKDEKSDEMKPEEACTTACKKYIKEVKLA